MTKKDDEMRELAEGLGPSAGRIFTRAEAADHVRENKASWSNKDSKERAPDHYCKNPDAKGKGRLYLYSQEILDAKGKEKVKNWNGKLREWPDPPAAEPEPEPLSAEERSRRMHTVGTLVQHGWADRQYGETLMGHKTVYEPVAEDQSAWHKPRRGSRSRATNK